MILGRECFGPLWRYVESDEITDIDFNGREVWLTNTLNERYRAAPDFVSNYMTSGFVEQFTNRIANIVSEQFNKRNPVLEAETPDLRVTIVHEAAARNGRTISIRKTPPIIRMTKEGMIAGRYCDVATMELLIASVHANMNMVFCGMPGVGKTEAIKFFSQFIPAGERVITIEDTLELRYGYTNPDKDCVELKVSEDTFDYSKAIKSSLRLNPRWIMLSEARSTEVKYLLESWSTGISGMCTLHTDDVRNVPDRILSMLENRSDADRLEHDIYTALDIGILIRKKKDETGGSYRCIDQLCFYYRENGVNQICMVVSGGEWTGQTIPESVAARLEHATIYGEKWK